MESELAAAARSSSSESKPDYILYQSMDKRLTLLDIPGSLREHCHVDPVVVEAPQEPFPSNEPKTAEKRKLVLQRQGVSEEGELYYQQLETELEAALLEIHQQMGQTPWCHERLPLVAQHDDNEAAAKEAHQPNPGLEPRVMSNPSNQPTSITHNSRHYTIPPHSTFLHATITAGTPAFLSSTPEPFSLILLDPPWHNRSARSAGNYRTSPTPAADINLLSQTLHTLAPHLRPRATIAIWLTNALSLRQHVIHTLSSLLHYSLDEEWIWLKTTPSGEPITPLHGVWRKSYETLLLFRHLPQKRRKGDLFPVLGMGRRIVVAVPNLHSQKPCLKGMFGREEEERVLEVFARGLVQGWWGWGDQALRGNEVACSEGQETFATSTSD